MATMSVRQQAPPSPPLTPPLDKASPIASVGANSPPSPTTRKPLPAPIGIPGRQRSATTSSASPRLLSSSPTHTPFSIAESLDARLPLQPPTSSVIQELSPPRSPRQSSASPTRTATPTTAPPKRPKSASPKLDARTDDLDILATNMMFATNSSAADAVVNGELPRARPQRPVPKRAASSKGGKWKSLFDFDGMLGALDPNRMATASAPEPIPTVVFGAETENGIAVCRALLAARHYALVALMVDDTTPATAELRNQGVRVVQIDMDNPASYHKELRGAKAVYLSSNVLALHAILQHQPEPKRTNIARQADRCQMTKAVNACARAKVGHLIFRVNACGHEIVENVLGKREVVMDAPDDIERLGIPHTVLHTTVPFSRLTEWLEDGPNGLVLNVPVPDDTQIPLFAVEQTGEYVLAALRNPKRWLSNEMHAISEVTTPKALATRLSKLARRPVDTAHVTRAEFDSLEFHERLACRWDAWSQLVTKQYDFDHVARATNKDVQDQWDLSEWLNRDTEIHKRLKF